MDALYAAHSECLIIIFDLRLPDGHAQLHRQRVALAGHTDVEDLDEDHRVLIIRPGWISEAAA